MGQKRTAFVVGGTGDIGAAVARRLAREGYAIAVGGRDAARVAASAAELGALGVALDLRDDASIDAAIGAVMGELGGLDAVVNAAGIAEPGMALRADREHYRRSIEANLVGAAMLSRAALQAMRRARSGAIVHIASSAGHRGEAGFAAYSAAKGGLLALSDSLRAEAARFGVRVATISPGKVDTRMHGDDPARAGMIAPDDVAAAVAFILALSPRVVVRDVALENAPAAS